MALAHDQVAGSFRRRRARGVQLGRSMQDPVAQSFGLFLARWPSRVPGW
jgi:hypothetical protein